MTETLTERQEKILAFIKRSIQEQGYPPTIREIGEAFGIRSTNGVNDHLKALERKGYLLRGELKVFALKVSGDSMIGDGIMDGDYIFVRKQLQASTGEIVVALIEDEATVKRYYPEGDRIRFQPSNPRLKPIYVAREEFRETQIIGVVVGVYRRMN